MSPCTDLPVATLHIIPMQMVKAIIEKDIWEYLITNRLWKNFMLKVKKAQNQHYKSQGHDKAWTSQTLIWMRQVKIPNINDKTHTQIYLLVWKSLHFTQETSLVEWNMLLGSEKNKTNSTFRTSLPCFVFTKICIKQPKLHSSQLLLHYCILLPQVKTNCKEFIVSYWFLPPFLLWCHLINLETPATILK